MTNKFQISNFLSSNYFQPDDFEFVFLSFVAYLFFGPYDLVIIKKND
jgi:hypothetical protein